MASHKDLIVWQKSYQLCLQIYSVTTHFPKSEVFAIVSQMQRAAVSIPSNIAEGNSRFGKKDHAQFIRIAYGSAAELETQVMLSKDLQYLSEPEYDKLIGLLSEVMKMLYVLLTRLSNV